ncbi:MAG: hypothetical protein WBB76_12765 [Gaiellaceae bacterium]
MRPSRIEAARGRVAGAKRFAVAAATVGFLGALLLARASHPGHTATAARSTSVSQAGSTQSSDDNGSLQLGSASVSTPATSAAPQVKTSVS